VKDKSIVPTDKELVMRETDFIVSKTDTKGRITYGNRIFNEFAGMSEQQLLGKQHNIIRHPDMPRCVFNLLWQRIQNNEEIFAYVKNMSADGSYYWVYANVTASLDVNGTIVGYYSVRRKPSAKAMELIPGLYDALKAVENSVPAKEQIAAGTKALEDKLAELGVTYDQFVYQLQG
jgi:PAS domain S-box-containing protein